MLEQQTWALFWSSHLGIQGLMGGLSFLVSSGTFHKTFWIKKYKGNCASGTGVAPAQALLEHLHQQRSRGWDSDAITAIPIAWGTMEEGHWHAGRGSFQVGFLKVRTGKAGRDRRWEVSKASSMAADTCFFQNRLNLSPCCHLSAGLGRSKPPSGWRARDSRAAPSLCTRASSSLWKGLVFSVLPRDLLGQVEVWALLLDRLSTSRREWAHLYSPTEPGVRDREVQGGFLGFFLGREI